MDRVDEITKGCFDAAIQVRGSEPSSLPAPETLHRRLCDAVDELLRRAGDAGFSQQDAQDMAYAVVALLDETVLARPEPHRQFWMTNLLQLHFFKENVAGEGFFERLEAIRGDPHRHEVLRVYYLALVFGFQGRFRVRGGEVELMRLIDSVQKELTRSYTYDAELLSPRGERPPEGRLQVRRNAPLLAISGAAVLLALLLFTGLRLSLSSTVSGVIGELGATRGAAPGSGGTR